MQASNESLVQAWNQYDEALEKKSAALPQLDRWYRIELPELILQRRHANDGCAGFVTQEELVQLMKWKLTVSAPYVSSNTRLIEYSEASSDPVCNS